MKAEHFFLTSTVVVAAPERWRAAFVFGQALDATVMLKRMKGLPPTHCIGWLHSSDPQWPNHLRNILASHSDARVVLLSNAPNPVEGLNAMNQGARGYSHAYAVPELLQEVALVVEHGGLWVGPDLLQRLVGSTNQALARLAVTAKSPELSVGSSEKAWAALSAREAAVARAVSAGHSNKEVARLMFISVGTVKAHLGAIFEKLGVRDRLQLVLRLSASADTVPPSDAGPTP